MQLVRDAAAAPADLDAVVDRLTAQGKQVSSNYFVRLGKERLGGCHGSGWDAGAAGGDAR